MIKTIIVEDEVHSRNYLRRCLEKHTQIEITAECADGRDSIEKVTGLKPDLLLLDIGIPDRDGFAVLNSLPGECMPVVIFITASGDYALKAFDYFAFDYILKPYEEQRVDVSVERAVRFIGNERKLELLRTAESLGTDAERGIRDSECGLDSPRRGVKALTVKVRNKTLLLPVREIDRAEAFGDYVKIYSGSKQYIYYSTMLEMEAKLGREFIRVHRSSLIRSDRIKEYQNLHHGDGMVTLNDGTSVRVSRNYRANLKGMLKKY